MPWIGVRCDVEAWELKKWAAAARNMGGAAVGDLLERMAGVMSGNGAGVAGADRMLEIEARAAASMHRTHALACRKAAAVMKRAMGEGVSLPAMMSAAGMDGWRAGSAAGDKNGGVAARRRKYPRGQAACGPDGGIEAAAERGPGPASVRCTVERDARYGQTWEGWAGVELRKAGFKMSRIAKGLGLDVTETWRHVSGFTKHWRREGLAGRCFPGPREGWIARLEEATKVALNTGVKGARVVLNGSGDCGVRRDAEEETEGES